MNLIPFINRGPDWIKPSIEEITSEGLDADKSYTAEQIKQVFEAVKDDPVLNAWAHLGLNGGFIPVDIADLPEALVQLDQSLIVFPRGKTGAGRICYLVPETVKALREYLAMRNKSKRTRPEAAHLFFRTRQGYSFRPVVLDQDCPDDISVRYNLVTKTWYRKVKLNLKFTGLRSTLATLADD